MNALYKIGPFGKSYFGRNMYDMAAVTSGLCYIEDLIFLENYRLILEFSHVKSIDSTVELYNIR